MKLGIISYFFPPNNSSGAQRWSKMSLYLAKKGFDVFVISSIGDKFGGEDFERYEYLKKYMRIYPLRTYGSYRSPRFDIVSRIIKLFLIPDSRTPFFLRYRNRIKEILISEKPDVLIITVPPFSASLLFPMFINLGIPYIVDLRDAWLSDPRRLNKLADFLIEREFLKNAKGVICINEHVLNEAKRFNENAILIPHFFDPEEYDLEPIKHKKVWVSHIGSVFSERDIGILKNVANRLGCVLRLVGPGSERFGGLGPVKRKYALREMISADVLVVILGKGKDQRLVSSVKLFEYLGAGKPIIVVSKDGYIRKVAEELGLGVCDFSEEDILGKIRMALKGEFKPKDYERFSIDRVGEELISYLGL